ncbi:hypothetical protein JTB14_000589 [Gonioctena quinquepunctata]|nr:hypothetical protein JTB14_000589 [Gonioctena quinquepunctata]
MHDLFSPTVWWGTLRAEKTGGFLITIRDADRGVSIKIEVCDNNSAPHNRRKMLQMVMGKDHVATGFSTVKMKWVWEHQRRHRRSWRAYGRVCLCPDTGVMTRKPKERKILKFTVGIQSALSTLRGPQRKAQ